MVESWQTRSTVPKYSLWENTTTAIPLLLRVITSVFNKIQLQDTRQSEYKLVNRTHSRFHHTEQITGRESGPLSARPLVVAATWGGCLQTATTQLGLFEGPLLKPWLQCRLKPFVQLLRPFPQYWKFVQHHSNISNDFFFNWKTILCTYFTVNFINSRFYQQSYSWIKTLNSD